MSLAHSSQKSLPLNGKQVKSRPSVYGLAFYLRTRGKALLVFNFQLDGLLSGITATVYMATEKIS
jgi:hypothetical protein